MGVLGAIMLAHARWTTLERFLAECWSYAASLAADVAALRPTLPERLLEAAAIADAV